MRVPEGFVAVSGVGARGFARPEAADWVRATLSRWGTLTRASRHEPDALAFTGRGTVRAVPAPGGDGRWVVRRYLRGGLVARLLDDRYLRRGSPRPLRETRASEAARARGIPTPAVMAGVIYPSGAWYRADLVTRYVPDSIDLADFLFRRGRPGSALSADHRAEALRQAGRLARALADAGIYHPDLNARNFLVVEGGSELQVLDLDRGRAVSGPIPLAPMAARLTRSLRKFETTTGVALGEGAWAAFRDATGDDA